MGSPGQALGLAGPFSMSDFLIRQVCLVYYGVYDTQTWQHNSIVAWDLFWVNKFQIAVPVHKVQRKESNIWKELPVLRELKHLLKLKLMK